MVALLQDGLSAVWDDSTGSPSSGAPDGRVWKGLEKVMVKLLSPCPGCGTSKRKLHGPLTRLEADSTGHPLRRSTPWEKQGS